ncbi:MAG TPA: hypothetical protein VD929_03015 [Caulobacteraceae bacterium]|nr:hypothetical protein [Caulobacteraceae bacterium]
MPDEIPRRRLSPAALLGLAVGVAAVGGAVGALTDDADGLLRGAGSVMALASAAGAIWLTLLHWRRLDEAAREAHKAAWYWGGSAGLAVAGVVTGVFLARPETPMPWRLGDGDAGLVATGLLLCAAAQMIGYLVAWAWWWLVRR